MPSEPVEKWFKSNRYARIDGQLLRPKKHPQIKDVPLSVQRGQAETIFLEDKDEKQWILKMFYNNKCPNAFYLNGVSRILPNNTAFRCGTERKILSKSSIEKDFGYYHSTKLAYVLENCVLMPHLYGMDWAAIADRIRGDETILSEDQRRLLCRNLAETVKLLEQNSISHRDLSSGNVFADPSSLDISLIDFDSVYHPRLPKPLFTAVGSEGYTAPFVDVSNIRSSYCELADRFAMAALCVEFLILCPESPFCHEGGIFNQEDINNRSGKTISYVQTELRKLYPEASKLFNSAINSQSFKNCPAPDDWIRLCENSGTCLSVNSLPEITFKKSDANSVVSVNLPNDPWKKKGKQKHGNNLQSNYWSNLSIAGSNRLTDRGNNVEVILSAMEDPPFNTHSYEFRANNDLLPELLPKADIKSPWKELLRKNLIGSADYLPLANKDFDYKRCIEKTFLIYCEEIENRKEDLCT